MNALSLLPAVLPAAPITPAGTTGTGEAVLFWILAPIMVAGALGLVFARKAIYAAMCMVLIMVSMAFLYVTQDAPFLGVAQVVVYTGAVMMLFLFVLMLVGVDMSDSLVETIRGQRWMGALFGLGLAAILIGVILHSTLPPATGLADANGDSNPQAVARLIFSDYVFTLELVGALLITAAVGALVLTHRQRLTPRIGQKDRAIARVKDGTQIPPLPAPGVYAHSNAADTPALDASGRPLELSVPRVLRIRGQVKVPHEVEAGSFVVTAAGIEQRPPVPTEWEEPADDGAAPAAPVREQPVEPQPGGRGSSAGPGRTTGGRAEAPEPDAEESDGDERAPEAVEPEAVESAPDGDAPDGEVLEPQGDAPESPVSEGDTPDADAPDEEVSEPHAEGEEPSADGSESEADGDTSDVVADAEAAEDGDVAAAPQETTSQEKEERP